MTTETKTTTEKTKDPVKKTAPAKKAIIGSDKKKVSESEFAVIKTGGKQYVVKQGQILKIEKLKTADKEGSDKIIFEEVLFIDDGKEIKVGTPFIEGAKVEAKFEENGRAKKITVIRYKRKTRYMKKKGHRQPYTAVTITAIK